MAVFGNPFKERATDRTASDDAFVRIFSPKILENLTADEFKGGVHLFVSPPGGGKTTLCRAFTPSVLNSFWKARDIPDMKESAKVLIDLGVLDIAEGPKVLGVQLTCLSGYADLPSDVAMQHDGLFKALMNCRIVLRALRSLMTVLKVNSIEQLNDITLEYPGELQELTAIPKESSPVALAEWAERCEREVYSHLDALNDIDSSGTMPAHVRFEGVLWLQGVKFKLDGKELIPRRLLMVDDLQALRRKQRDLLIRELMDMRPKEPIWLAQRTSALNDTDVLSGGAREGRDIHVHSIETLLKGRNGFSSFAQSVLERRFETQTLFSRAKFEQFIGNDISQKDLKQSFNNATECFKKSITRIRSVDQYQEWIANAETIYDKAVPALEDIRALYSTRILISRNENSRQLSFIPLPAEEIEERDSSGLQGASDVFAHYETGLPYYYGLDTLCAMATNNIEELLGLAARLYEGMEANHMLRRAEVALTVNEQEKLFVEAARKKRDFIPRSHAEGTRAQLLIDSIGSFCREKTLMPNAPYAPGVTGIRISQSELDSLMNPKGGTAEQMKMFRRVLTECVADNLLFIKPSSATTGREGGQVFYLNRTLCVHYGLPLNLGGWQDIKVTELIEWAQIGRRPTNKSLEL